MTFPFSHLLNVYGSFNRGAILREAWYLACKRHAYEQRVCAKLGFPFTETVADYFYASKYPVRGTNCLEIAWVNARAAAQAYEASARTVRAVELRRAA